MKKTITLILLVMATLTAQAQYWVGGSMSIDRTKENNSREDIDRKTSFRFCLSPELGYHLTDKVALGFSATYEHEYFHLVLSNANVPNTDQTKTGNYYRLTPFVRYYFNTGRFRLFADGELPFSIDHTSGYDYSAFDIGLALRPGVQFEICPRMGLLSYLGSLSFAHHWHDNFSSNNLYCSLRDEIYLGIYFNL